MAVIVFFPVAIVGGTWLSPAEARPVYMNTLAGQVKCGKVENKCNTCHDARTRAMNLFGKDYFNIFRIPDETLFPGVTTLTDQEKWDLLLQLSDSNLNGFSNIEDIQNKVNPGL